MCGIAGFYSVNAKFSRDDLENMTGSLTHRGPDAEGTFFDNFTGLGHRRLSIIDLSEAANQPMYSHCKRYVIAYNGEVYNFREISKELQDQFPGYQFITSSDTEVILEAFARWGADFVKKLNGMFSISIYDIQDNSLYLFRDREGVKPLYYFFHDGNFAFASELKALMKCPYINQMSGISPAAVNKYLHLGFIPGPDTIYNKIRKFPSGSYAIIKNTDFRLHNYWNINEIISGNVLTDECEAKRRLKELIISSVKYRLICDVPFGVFLSGGIDSSLITGVARSISDNQINTFSIGFKDAQVNESGYAKSIAGFFQTNHHEFIVGESDAIELVPLLPCVFDEPFADDSALPSMLISRLARREVSMVLSGDGGDELFMGYGAYSWASRLSNPLVHLLRRPISSVLSAGNSRLKRIACLFKYDDKNLLQSHIFSQEQYFFHLKELKNIFSPEWYEEFIPDGKIINPGRLLTASENQSFFDLEYYLKDDLLVKVDRASMKYSLETRVPLLDYRIIEFAVNLSPGLKINNAIRKYLLKEVLYDYIPESYFNRPKHGFSVPLGKWLKKELKYLVDHYLSDEMIKKYGIVNPNYLAKLKNNFNSGHTYLYNRLWALIILHLWLENQKQIQFT